MAATVMLVDYDPRSIARIRGLIEQAGLHAIVVRDGRLALEQFAQRRPDLTLIQDLVPNLHGFEVCRRIKDTEIGAQRPIVLLCGRHKHGAIVATGCDAYIHKPFADIELVGVVRQLMPATSHPDVTPADAIEHELDARLEAVVGSWSDASPAPVHASTGRQGR